LLKTFVSLTGAHVAMAAFSFATTILLANSLGAEVFGQYSYAVAIGGYVFTIAAVGMEQTQVRDLVQTPERSDEFVSGGFILTAIMLLIASFVLLATNVALPEDNRLSIVGVVLAVVLGAKALDLRPFYDATDRMKLHVSFLTIERFVYFAAVWFVFLFLRSDLSIRMLAILLTGSTVIGLGLQYVWASKRVRIGINRAAIRRSGQIFRSNLWIWGALLATLSFGGLSKIVLRNVSGDAELGGYAVAWQIVTVGSLLMSQVGQIGNPRLARSVIGDINVAERNRFMFRYFVISAGVGAAVGLPAILFPTAILSLFREEYVSVAPAMRILGGYVIAIGISQVATQYLVAVRKEATYLTIIIASGLLGPVLFWAFIPEWESTGAAAAVLISHSAGILLLVGAVYRHMRISGGSEMKRSQ
jgi:O-antigen/teichoic acid export membrane protein